MLQFVFSLFFVTFFYPLFYKTIRNKLNSVLICMQLTRWSAYLPHFFFVLLLYDSVCIYLFMLHSCAHSDLDSVSHLPTVGKYQPSRLVVFFSVIFCFYPHNTGELLKFRLMFLFLFLLSLEIYTHRYLLLNAHRYTHRGSSCFATVASHLGFGLFSCSIV